MNKKEISAETAAQQSDAADVITSSQTIAKPLVACSFSSSETKNLGGMDSFMNNPVQLNEFNEKALNPDWLETLKTEFEKENTTNKLSIFVKHEDVLLFIMLNPSIHLIGSESFTCMFKKRFNFLDAVHATDINYIAQFPMSYFKQVSTILEQKPESHVEYTVQLNELVFCSPI
jgi:hypothetical protein